MQPPPQSPTAHPQIHATLRRGKATAIVPGVHGAEEVLGPQWVGATKITTTPENTALLGKVFAKENHVVYVHPFLGGDDMFFPFDGVYVSILLGDY